MLITRSKNIAGADWLEPLLGTPIALERVGGEVAASGKKFTGYVEEGFLAYLRHPICGHSPLSVVIDRTGIHYDSTRPSDLQSILIQTAASWTDGMGARARRIMATIRRLRLSKYNHQEGLLGEETGRRYRVLLVDQSTQSRALRYGGANTDIFEQMMDSSCKGFPETDLVVKMHPDHDLNRAKSILHGRIRPGVSALPPRVNIWSVLNQVDVVYTVSSQVGFEALMAGKKVVCFGQPFYSGWGLTTDVASGRGSGRQLTLEQLVYGVLVKYPLYIHPERQELCDIEEILSYLESAHLGALGFYDRIYTVGLRPQEKRTLPEYLRGHLALDVNHISPKSARSRTYGPTEAVLYWDPRECHGDDLSYLESRGVSVLRAGPWPMDPIQGDQAQPNILQITRNRLYNDGSPRNDLVLLLEQAHFDFDLLRRAETLQQNFLAVLEQESKIRSHALNNQSVGRWIALVLGQGEGEGPWGVREKAVSTDHELLTQVRLDFPEAYILYAPPVGESYSENHVPMSVDPTLYDQLVRPEHTVSCFKLADAVHVVSAFRGIYALIYGKLLYTYGRPFYAGWGLTHDAEVFVGRSKQRSLTELLCATFILAPTYFNWLTRTSGTPEEAVRRLFTIQSQEDSRPKVRTRLPIQTGRLSAWLGPLDLDIVGTFYRKMTAVKRWKKTG